jgi:8-oxo-dGTP pyrophosphatase MutT (NUDIX family)
VSPPVVSVGWLCVRDGRLLVVRTRGRDAFYLPGGKPEPGESLRRALRREVAEELGSVLDPASITEAFVVHDRAHGLPGAPLRMHCYTADAPSGAPRPWNRFSNGSSSAPPPDERAAPVARRPPNAIRPALGVTPPAPRRCR